MADVPSDGMTRITLVIGASSIANVNAPTVAELNAGINATTQITSDGMMGWEAATAGVTNTSLASTVDTALAGRDSFSGPKLRFKEQEPADTIKSTLLKGVKLFVVIRRALLTGTANTIGQKVAVHPVQCGRRIDMPHEDNSLVRFEIPFFVHADPAYDAVVA